MCEKREKERERERATHTDRQKQPKLDFHHWPADFRIAPDSKNMQPAHSRIDHGKSTILELPAQVGIPKQARPL